MTAWRQAVALLCAAAILAVSFSHEIEHFAQMTSAAGAQVSTAPTGTMPDPPKQPAVVQHCHGCTMIAVAVVAEAASPVLPSIKLSPAPAAFLREGLRAVEPPPPKFLI
jgi:hypothetical protein